MLQFSKTLVVIPLIFLCATHISSGQQIPTNESPPTVKSVGTSGLPVQRPMVPQQSMRPLTSNRQNSMHPEQGHRQVNSFSRLLGPTPRSKSSSGKVDY